MASALDKLREHTAALEAVVKAAQEIERVLERVRVDLVPAVDTLCQLNSEIEKRRQGRRGEAVRWALFGSFVGGLVASLLVLMFCK